MMPASSTPERHARWQRYLADIENYAVVPQPLEMQGTLVRVTGLVLEAAGVRVPVGSVCDVSGSPNEPPITAEVVGFDGDRA
jgi:flagellum-specific ATP synthase